MEKRKNQPREKWQKNLYQELGKAILTEPKGNIIGVNIYIAHPPVMIRISEVDDGEYKSSTVWPERQMNLF